MAPAGAAESQHPPSAVPRALNVVTAATCGHTRAHCSALGATGLAQCAELTWQLSGTADKRQVEGVTAALQHNIGLGGAAVVTAYQRAER